jgi:hypothetical protein
MIQKWDAGFPAWITWFGRLRRRPRASKSRWIAARLDDMPKYGNDYYVSFTIIWHVLISLVRIRDAGVPYHFCHLVENEDRHDMRDRRGSFVSDENCQIMAWNAGKPHVGILDNEKFSGKGDTPLALPTGHAQCAAGPRLLIPYWPMLSVSFLSRDVQIQSPNSDFLWPAIKHTFTLFPGIFQLIQSWYLHSHNV